MTGGTTEQAPAGHDRAGDLPATGARGARRVTALADLARAGVDPADVEQYRAALDQTHGTHLTSAFAADLLCGDLRTLGEFSSQMTVRAALGWTLTCRSCSDTARTGPGGRLRASGHPWRDAVRHQARPWVESGLGESGWLCAAAGLSRREALGQAGRGGPDRAALATLALLRGARLPATG